MVLKRAFSLVLLLLPLTTIVAQDPAEYSFSKNSPKEKIFFDDFEKFNNYWLLGIEEGSWIENIENGQLFFQSLTDKPKEDLLPVIIDQNRDFEIESQLRFVEGKMDKGYGLQWGKAVNPMKQFDFLLTAAGHFTLDKYTGEFHDFVPFTLSDKVNRYAANKLTIRKVGDKYYFFLNEHLVHTMPFEPFYGNMLGFQVAENSTILVDYIEVAYLDRVQSGKSKVLIMDYKFDAENDIVVKGVPVTLTVNLVNVGEKDAEELEVKAFLPEGVTVIDFKKIESLNAKEEKQLSLQFFVSKDFKGEKIPVIFDILGADITNAKDLDLYVMVDLPVTSAVDKAMAQTYSDFRGGNDPLKGLNVAQAMKSVEVGNYFALVIGIDNYSGEWPKLRNAVNDAKVVSEVLKSKYVFTQIKTLFNEEATRDNILSQFEWLMNSVRQNDNLLVYYSGHGEYSEAMGKGFWVPVDANSKSITKYISNEDIKSFLTGINSKHTLLVTDACFSGDIFRGKTMTIPYESSTKYYQKIYSLSSRKAMTSGGVEPVMDKGKDGHSVFAYYFLKALNDNSEKYFDAGQIYNYLKIPVVNNSYQEPAYSPIRNTGDEGGQFIFIKRE